MEFSGCTDYLISMLLLDEHSCQEQIFVIVFFKLYCYAIIEYVRMWNITVILIKKSSDTQK